MFNLFFFFSTTALKFDFLHLGGGGVRLNIIIFFKMSAASCPAPYLEALALILECAALGRLRNT
jgi:hypothetical protein